MEEHLDPRITKTKYSYRYTWTVYDKQGRPIITDYANFPMSEKLAKDYASWVTCAKKREPSYIICAKLTNVKLYEVG